MERIKRILKKLIFLPYTIIIILVPISMALVVYSLAFSEEQGILSYISYALSAYALTVLCVRIPDVIVLIKDIKENNTVIKRLREDTRLRINISLYIALTLNTAYAIFQLGLGFYHSSFWFHSLAVYYILLALMRFSLLRYTRAYRAGGNIATELRRYRLCGMVLVLMNLALAAIVFFMTWQNRSFYHHEITTIALAAYTFTAFTLGVVNVVRYRKYNSPVFSASKVISFTASSVSMLTLESAMLTTFGGEGQEQFRLIITAISGACVTVLVLAMAIYMIVKATKQLNQINTNQQEHSNG